MLHALARNWWIVLLRGIAAIVFGVLAFAWPGLTLRTLVLLYGAYALVDGIIALAAAFTGRAMPLSDLVAHRGWGCWASPPGSDLPVARYHRHCAGPVHRRVGCGARHFRNHRAIQLRHEIDNEWLLILPAPCP